MSTASWDRPTRELIRGAPDRSPWVSSSPCRPCRLWLWSTCRASVDLPQSIGPWKNRRCAGAGWRRRSPAAGTTDSRVAPSGARGGMTPPRRRSSVPRHGLLGPSMSSPARSLALRWGVAGRDDRAADGQRGQRDEAGHEEDDEADDGQPVGTGQLVREAERQRAQPAGAAVADLVEAVVLGLLARRDELTEQRPGQRLRAALHQSDDRGE